VRAEHDPALGDLDIVVAKAASASCAWLALTDAMRSSSNSAGDLGFGVHAERVDGLYQCRPQW
jgi:hypothetical protein